MMEITFSLDELTDAAQKILRSNLHDVVLFNGDMGAGKTTLIKELCRQLGVKTQTSSPTFSLVNEYQAEDGLVYHFDMYRVKSETEALDMGIEEYLYSGNRCFIEWPGKIPNLIPNEHSTVGIAVMADGRRKITIV